MRKEFALSVSVHKYADKNKIQWKAVKYRHEELSIDKFIELVKEGYCFCQCFTTDKSEFGLCTKRDDNFKTAQLLFVDVDDVEIPMNEFVSKLTQKPTVAYTTPNNHTEKSQWLYRFRLCYLFEEPMTSIAEYCSTYDSVMYSIGRDIKDLKMKDNCGRKVSQQFGGNAREDMEVITSNRVYSFSDFPLQNNNVSFSFLRSETEKVCSPREEVTITDIDFMTDLNKLSPTELIDKYREQYPYITHTELKYENGYALIPDDYQEIYRSWYMSTYERQDGAVIRLPTVKIHRDGEGRRKKLFVAGLVVKKILPTISYEHLMFILIYERTYHYDNSDKVLTNDVLKGIARNVMQTPLEEIRLQSRSKKKYVVDKEYCAEHGISANTMKNRVRKILNDKQIGEAYDCSKSVKENLILFKEMGMEVGKTKLYEWCKENGINPKGKGSTVVQPNVREYTEILCRYFMARHDEKILLRESMREWVRHEVGLRSA